MGKFEVKVTKRNEEWAKENAPLEDGAPSCRPTGPEHSALACGANCTITNCTGDTPGYDGGGEVSPLD